MIETKELRKDFGMIRAVDRLSMKVEPGEVLGFLGPNGAGKSTTMKMLTGFLRPSGGRATVAGCDILSEPLAVKHALGYLPEGAPAYPDMTPEGFLRFCAAVRGLRGAERKQRIGRAAALAHLEGVMRQPIETLSKGYKRRVGLAQALLHDPGVLILDEPTDGLDPNQKHEVRELIRAMVGRKCVVLSTHILEEVEAVCTRAVIIARGKIVADGTPEELRARAPSHNSVTFTVRGDTGGLMEAIRGIEGVASVDRSDGDGRTLRCTARAANGRPIAPEIGKMIRDRGLELEEFTVEQGRLDEVFRDVTAAPAGKGG